jgi:hypothetical protein
MKMKRLLCMALVLPLLYLSSCTEEIDTDQWDQLRVAPTLTASILYLESTEALINASPGNEFYAQTLGFEPFSEPYLEERLVEGSITYELENTTSKPLSITLEYLDADGNVLDTELFVVPAQPTPILVREVNYGTTGKPLSILLNTTEIRVTALNLGDNSSVSPEPDPKVKFRTAAEFTINLKEG